MPSWRRRLDARQRGWNLHKVTQLISSNHAGRRRMNETKACIRKVSHCKRDTRLCYINRIWPPRRDNRWGVLIGAGGTQQSDWPRAHVITWADMQGPRLLAREERLIQKRQLPLIRHKLNVPILLTISSIFIQLLSGTVFATRNEVAFLTCR